MISRGRGCQLPSFAVPPANASRHDTALGQGSCPDVPPAKFFSELLAGFRRRLAPEHGTSRASEKGSQSLLKLALQPGTQREDRRQPVRQHPGDVLDRLARRARELTRGLARHSETGGCARRLSPLPASRPCGVTPNAAHAGARSPPSRRRAACGAAPHRWLICRRQAFGVHHPRGGEGLGPTVGRNSRATRAVIAQSI